MPPLSRLILFAAVSVVVLPCSRADQAKVLTNHVGYEASGSKHAIIQGSNADNFISCTLNDARDDNSVLTIPARHVGPVQKWRDWNYWTIDFDSFTTEGSYYLACSSGDH